jgi:hypothetical protein
VIGWPSATVAGAVSVTRVASSESVTSVDTGVLLGASLSKLPPVTSVMAAFTGAWPLMTSLGALTETVPVVWPTGMVMTRGAGPPLFSVTTNGVPETGVGTVAV